MFATKVDAVCTTLNAEINRRLDLLMFSVGVEFTEIFLSIEKSVWSIDCSNLTMKFVFRMNGIVNLLSGIGRIGT